METVELSIVIPLYNEAQNIAELRERLEKILKELAIPYEVIIVDDGSTDTSALLIEKIKMDDQRWRLIQFSRNFGHQIAITAGLEFAQGRATIIMDADLQDPPELIPALVDEWKKGHEIVYAQRRERKDESWFKKISARIFYLLLQKISKTQIPPNVGDLRLLDRAVVDALKKMKETHRFLRGMISWIGFSQKAVVFDRHGRFAGTTHYTFRKMMRLALDGITSFSKTPLRLATYLGFIVALFSFVYAAYTLVHKFIFHTTIQGWASLMTALLFLGSIQLICIGIVGEYVGRIYEEGKKRPLYVIKNADGQKNV